MNQEKTNEPLSKTAVSGSVILPSHLRIRNLVMKNDAIYEIWSLKRKELELYSEKLDQHLNSCKYEELLPIPITEELLLKLNAEKIDLKDFGVTFLLGKTQWKFINGLPFDYLYGNEIQGLHHLQNFIYFKTGKELDVSVLTDH